jgi:hypothetical protein
MRRIVPGLALLVLAAQPARAASILYATAATPGRVDGFCVSDLGYLSSTPSVTSVYTRGAEPRRLLVAKTTATLYVAEVDRVEAFRIGPAGGLTRIGRTEVLSRMGPRDLALSADERTLYVPQPGYDRVVAYPLDGLDAAGMPGVPAEKHASCIQGEVQPGFQYLLVNGSLLYVSATGAPSGRVDVFAVGADGSLPAAPEQCLSGSANVRSDPTVPLSTRHRLERPRAMVLSEGILYVELLNVSQIVAFQLQPDGTFCDLQPTLTAPNGMEDCTAFPTLETPKCHKRQEKKRREQCAFSATNPTVPYEGVVQRGEGEKKTLLAVNFSGGRIDMFRLKPESQLPEPAPYVRLPKAPAQSVIDVRTTPARLLPNGDNVLYVASGAADRVLAFRVGNNGRLNLPPFSQTDRQKNSFPNDVALFDGLEQCR